jgi:hypothetical protein
MTGNIEFLPLRKSKNNGKIQVDIQLSGHESPKRAAFASFMQLMRQRVLEPTAALEPNAPAASRSRLQAVAIPTNERGVPTNPIEASAGHRAMSLSVKRRNFGR